MSLRPFCPPLPPQLAANSFALAAGLTSAVSSSSVIVLAVASELVAGAISMGLGGYLSGRVEADTHEAERLREVWEVQHKPNEEENEVVEVLTRFGLSREQCEPVLAHFREHPDLWGMWKIRGRRGGGEQRESVGRLFSGGTGNMGVGYGKPGEVSQGFSVGGVCLADPP